MAWYDLEEISKDEYNDGKDEDGNFDISDKLLKTFKEKNCQIIKKVKQIGLPKKGEQVRLITTTAFNSISIISHIAQNEIIQDAVFIIFAINKQAAQVLIELKKEGHFKKCQMIISSIRNAGIRDKSQSIILLEPHFNITFITSHAKIVILKTKNNYYSIEGSGNFSWNARVEQYIIDNDIKLYDFSKNWMKEIIKLKKQN